MDYTGMSPEAIHEVGLIIGARDGMSLIYFLVFVFVIAIFIGALTQVRKSKPYRQFLTDMFVAGKIRSYAKLDSIDLDDEELKFKTWSKKNRTEPKALDNVIEEDLSDRIAEDKFNLDNKSKTTKGTAQSVVDNS